MAAGVTDRLWEMVDVVDMLDAFETKRKRVPKVTFEIDDGRSAAVIMCAPRYQTARLIGSKVSRPKVMRGDGLKMNRAHGCIRVITLRMGNF
jgi:hypothetical protein